MKPSSGNSESNAFTAWLKKLGWIGFLFFLVKGLIWLGVIAWFGNEVTK